MARRDPTSRGASIVERLRCGRNQAANALLPGARELPLLHGVTPKSHFTRPAENALAEARQLLIDSGKVFLYGNSMVVAVGEGADGKIITVCIEHRVEKYAPAVLANIFLCELATDKEDSPPLQFALPFAFVSQLLNGFQIRDSVPRIQAIFRRPAYDENFALQGPGWHPDSGFYVQGLDIEPIPLSDRPSGGTVLDRCPPILRELLNGFCFRSPADVANSLAVLLTGVLANHFAESGKPNVLVDGNQPSVGKTLLARANGAVLDGIDPTLIEFTANDEELTKRICSKLREGPTSVLIFDNAKNASGAPISSTVVEAQSMAPQVSLRILSQSVNITVPNLMLWIITMNSTRASPDTVSRGIPVRLEYEGKTDDRTFAHEQLIAYAIEHRAEILGELFGMIERWTLTGRPNGQRNHRCSYWARIVGGILEANGIPEFLANRDEAAAEFNIVFEQLSALAEAAIALGGPIIEVDNLELFESSTSEDERWSKGQSASEWGRYFLQANVSQDRLENSTSRSARADLLRQVPLPECRSLC